MERVVGADHHLGSGLQPGGAFDLPSGRELVGDQDRWNAAVDHDLGLGHLGAGDPDRTRSIWRWATHGDLWPFE